MDDHTNESKRAEFGDNPFSQLNKKAFPDKKAAQRPVAAVRAKAAEPEADGALFSQAVHGVTPLDTSKKMTRRDEEQHTGWKKLVSEMKSPALPPKKRAKHGSASPKAQPFAEKSEDKTVDDALNDFAAVMKDVTPLNGKGRELPAASVVRTPPPVVEHDTESDVFFKDKLEFSFHHTDEYVEGHVVGLDLITVGKLQAGQFSPEAHLDLHGLNALQAYQHLVGFMRNAYMRNQRTVLLVPGRGLNSPNGMPILREKVRTWLTQDPFRRVVLAFCTAQPADGGAGALYVLLRKFRKDQGKVYWDRVPVDPDLLMD